MTTTPSGAGTLVGTAATSPLGSSTSAHRHDLVRQSDLLRDSLQSDRIRLGMFLGAGCPLGVYDDKGEKSLGLIPDVATLTGRIYEELKTLDGPLSDGKKRAPCWDSLVQGCKDGGDSRPNVENILTELRTITGRKGKKPLDGIEKERLIELDEMICDLIVDAVGKSLPAHACAYTRLAIWVGDLQRSTPVELFTPNYDLLFEQAFEGQRIPHFDGFVGSREPFFDIASIEQDAVPDRWARIWKLHGSINWQTGAEGAVFRAQGRAAKGKAMIYPSHLKYDQSRRMPYLAMIDRLRAFFRSPVRSPTVAPPVLVVCGYSFSDDHLNEVLLDGLRGNKAAQCFVLEYKKLEDAKTVAGFAAEHPNMTVLAYDGAVVGTRSGSYADSTGAVSPTEPWIEVVPAKGSAGTSPPTLIRCRLGDFHFFTLFLEQLYGGRSVAAHAPTLP